MGHFWTKKIPINLGPLRKFQNIFHILGHFRTFKVSGHFVNIYCGKIILVYFRTMFPDWRISVKSHFIAITLIVQHQTSFKVSFWIQKSNHKWVKVFKNWPSKKCGRLTLRFYLVPSWILCPKYSYSIYFHASQYSVVLAAQYWTVLK